MVGVYESEAFAGTTSLVIDVGTSSGDPDEFIDALDVDAMSAPSSTQVMPSQVINHNLWPERTAQHPYFSKLRMPQSHQLPPEDRHWSTHRRSRSIRVSTHLGGERFAMRASLTAILLWQIFFYLSGRTETVRSL